MTNFEKYRDEILRITKKSSSIALINGVPVGCESLDDCFSCDLYHKDLVKCRINLIKWLYEEYTEPEIDWSKVAIDAPILVQDIISKQWLRRYFAGLDENGNVLAWSYGKTSWTTDGDKYRCKYAKLAEVK